MQEFIGDEEIVEGNENPTKHLVSKLLLHSHNL
jgi:hypothetical protein